MATTLLLFVAILGWALLLRHQRAAERNVNDAVQKERLRLSQDLHDGYQQLLAGCMFRLTAAMTLSERIKGGGASALWWIPCIPTTSELQSPSCGQAESESP